MSNRESDQMQYLQTQIEIMKQEDTQTSEQIMTITDQCKEYETHQMEVGFSKKSIKLYENGFFLRNFVFNWIN